MAQDRIEQEITIEASREQVWDVLTDPEHISNWFGDSTQADLRPGGKMIFTWSEHGSHHAVVERIEPPEFFSYRWARPIGEDPGEGSSTLVEFTLIAAGDDTVLRVVESGFASLHASEQDKDSAVNENTQGWISELGELQAYAEQLAGT